MEYVERISRQPLVAFFFARGADTKYLNTLTLHFTKEKKDLEQHYQAFHNESSVALVFFSALIAIISLLAYIVLDLSFPKTFFQLLLVRLISAGVMSVLLVILCFSKVFRCRCNYLATVVLFGTISAGTYTLILRDDTDFSPFFMALLWVNMHFGASFLVERTITGLLLIIMYTVVWIYVVHYGTMNLLNTQTLTYVIFFIGAVLSAYSREAALRQVYLAVHNLIPGIRKDHSFLRLSSIHPSPSVVALTPSTPTVPPSSPITFSASPTDNNSSLILHHLNSNQLLLNTSSSHSPCASAHPEPSSALSLAPSYDPTHSPPCMQRHSSNIIIPMSPDNSLLAHSPSICPPAPASGPSTPVSGSPLSIPPANRGGPSPASLPPSPAPSLHTSSPLPSSPALPLRTPSLPPANSLSNYIPVNSYSPATRTRALTVNTRERDWFDDVHDRIVHVTSRCFPPTTFESKEPVVTDLHYHKEVYRFMRMNSYRVSRRFCNPDLESRFVDWHRVTTELSVRRFFLLNIISTILLISHDLSFDTTDGLLYVVLGLRFGVIIPSLVLCFIFGSIYTPTTKYRGTLNTILEFICTATSLVMGILIWHNVKAKDLQQANGAYDLYFGIVSRYLIYGYSGMGLRWIQSTAIGGTLTLLFVLLGCLLGFPLSIFSVFVAVVGFTLAYTEEKTKRTEFMLTYCRDDVIIFLEGKATGCTTKQERGNSDPSV